MFQKYYFTVGTTIYIVKNLRLATERTKGLHKHNSPMQSGNTETRG